MFVPLSKYVDALPIPPVLHPKGVDHRGATYYVVTMREVAQQLHRDLPPTPVWGYEGLYPGPTIEVRREERVAIKWMNALPERHLLPVDVTVRGADMPNAEVRTVVHVHGAHVAPESDGHPEAWFTNGFAEEGPMFDRRVYEYTNDQPAASLWYHDQALGIARLNIYAGLAGAYLIRDDEEADLNLPRGRFEIPLFIQDRSFNDDGSLFYPHQPDPPVPGVEPSVVPEFFGDAILVNGKVWPYLNVAPRKYRFRIYNASNSRFYRLRLSSGQPFYQIGADGGFLPRTVTLDQLTLGPAERADVIIDFSRHRGERITLLNDAPTPFPDGSPVDPDTTGKVMQFCVVSRLTEVDTSEIPEHLTSVWKPRLARVSTTRTLTLVETTDEHGRLMPLLTGQTWDDPVTEEPRIGSTEIWQLLNLTAHARPVHIHLVRFLVLDRRPFDVAHYQSTGQIRYTGPAVPAAPNEAGFKDTVRIDPGMVTRIIMRFKEFTGEYVWHCQNLEYQDYRAIRPYVVRPRGSDLHEPQNDDLDDDLAKE